MTSREHFMADRGGVVRDPILLEDPARCRRSTRPVQGVAPPPCDGTLGPIVDGKADCLKCGLAHGFMVIKGQIRYGALL